MPARKRKLSAAPKPPRASVESLPSAADVPAIPPLSSLGDGAQRWKGADQLRPLLIPLGSVHRDPDNARLHGKRNMHAIQTSLGEFGQTKPIVIHKGIVIAGNGTHEAAEKIGWTHIAGVLVDHMSAEQAQAYALMDNKAGDLSEWDYQKLAGRLANINEVARRFTGFEEFEIKPLLAAQWQPPAVQGEETTGSNIVKLSCTRDQFTVIEQAIEALRAAEGDKTILEGRALELICADYLAGVAMPDAAPAAAAG